MAIIKGRTSQISSDVRSASKTSLIELVKSIDIPDIKMAVSQLQMLGNDKVIFIVYASEFASSTSEGLAPSNVFIGRNHQLFDTSAFDTYIVGQGKRFVILGFSVSTRNVAAAVQGLLCRLRVLPIPGRQAAIASNIGNVTSNPMLLACACGTTMAIAGIGASHSITASAAYPGLIELPGSIGFRVTNQGTLNGGNSFCLWGYEY